MEGLAGDRSSSLDRLGVSGIRRLVETSTVLLWHGVRILVRKVCRSRRAVVGEELSAAFQRLGSTYVKFGQVVASSPGLFPVEMSRALAPLFDQVCPVPFEDVRRVVEQELGRPLEEIFSSFDPEPMASASMAQVHAATLAGGREVAVKVQRPGIRRQLDRDLRVLMALARLFERLPSVRVVQPIAVVRDFARTLGEELDFEREARSIARFETNLRAFGANDRVRVPQVVHSLTGPRVLTMERIHGRGFVELLGAEDHELDLVDLVRQLAKAWLEAAFEHGFFHGDLHAGNLMVDAEGKLTILDFGIMGELDPAHREILRNGLPKVFRDDDLSEAARAFYEMGTGGDPGAVTRACADLAAELAPVLSLRLEEISFAELFVGIIRVGARHRVQLPVGMILVTKVLLYIDRYMSQLAPDWVMLSDVDLIWFLMDPTEALSGQAEAEAAG